MAFIPGMGGSGGSGGSWTNIKTSSATGTLEHKSMGNGLYVIRAHLGSGAGTAGNYKKIGEMPSGTYNTSSNTFLMAMNGGLQPCAFRIQTNGDLDFYVPSGYTNTQCECDVIYTV